MRRLALVCLLLVSPAAADDDDVPSKPAPVRVQARLEGPTAKVAVRYVVPFAAHKSPSVTIEVALPRRGVVTGGSVTIDGITHPLTMMLAMQADEALDRMTHSQAGPLGWAANVYTGFDATALDIYAPRGGIATVDLEVEAPTCFFRDMRYLSVPETWSKDEGDQELADACRSQTGAWLRFSGADLSQRASTDARIVSRVDRLHVASADIARVELDLARELADVPRDLHTAFVVDASRSMGDEQRTAQAAIIASYLERAPHTAVQVVAFARKAHALLPRWQASEAAAPGIARELKALVPRNGSNVDVGLAEASAWLAREGGTRRIVLFTDERLADRLTVQDPASWARLLPAGTLVHVVALTGGAIDRDDEALLAHLASATGGIAVRGGTDDKGFVDARELVQPIAIDHVSVHANAWNPLQIEDEIACKDRLVAGTSCMWWARGHEASDTVTFEGFVWGKKLVRVLHPDAARSRAVARELVVAGVTDEPLQKEIDRAAVAVDKQWSLFARWGGERLPEEQTRYGGIGGICGCDGHEDTIGFSSGNGVPPIDLHDQLAPLVEACHPAGAHVAIDLELTVDEVVDVWVQGGGAALRTCVSESIWNTAFTVANAREHATVHVAF